MGFPLAVNGCNGDANKSVARRPGTSHIIVVTGSGQTERDGRGWRKKDIHENPQQKGTTAALFVDNSPCSRRMGDRLDTARSWSRSARLEAAHELYSNFINRQSVGSPISPS